MHRERQARATIVLTPVDNPSAYGLVETDEQSNIQRFLEKPKPEEITTNHINAGIYVLEPDTFDRIPSEVPWSIERSYFPSLIERSETFVAYVYNGYWIDIGTPEKYMQVHRDIMDGRFVAPPFAGLTSSAAMHRAGRRESKTAPLSKDPVFIDEGVLVKAGARIGPYAVIGRQTQVEEEAIIERAIVWPNCRVGSQSSIADAVLGRQCHIGRNVSRQQRRGAGRQDDADRFYESLTIVRHGPRSTVMGTETEDWDRGPNEIHAHQPRHLQGLRHPRAVSRRDQRDDGETDRPRLRQLSEGVAHRRVARHARLVAGACRRVHRRRAREQGATVVDYGMLPTDVLYFAVVNDNLEGGAQITASHNPKQYNGIKMVRAEALPLSGDAGIGDIRDMIANDRLPPPAATRGGLTTPRRRCPATSRR